MSNIISLSLYNKIANDILLQVKPVKLRKQIVSTILEVLNDEYQRGFSAGCEYVTKVEELAARNEELEKQLAELSNDYNQVLNQLLEARKPIKKKKKEIDRPVPGQLTMFDVGDEQ